jgi:hypothetical protein
MKPGLMSRVRRRGQIKRGVISREPTPVERILGDDDASLLDVVDNALNKGVVLTGELTISVAQIDLIYARISLLLCAVDRVLPNEDPNVIVRHSARRAARLRAAKRSRA